MTTVVWFTYDLRLHDHPALMAAAGDDIVPVFVLDKQDPWFLGSASRWWLYHSLKALDQSLARMGGHLIFRQGDTLNEIMSVAKQVAADQVVFTRAYEPWLCQQQKQLFEALTQTGVRVRRFGSRALIEPETLSNRQGLPFKVFTPFYKTASARISSLRVQPTPKLRFSPHRAPTDTLTDWALLPSRPNWSKGFAPLWQPGEDGATAQLREALETVIDSYSQTRDLPSHAGTSRLAPHLHFGEVSPRQVWVATQNTFGDRLDLAEPFVRQLYWREFGLHLLHHFPHTPERPFNTRFSGFPWRKNAARLKQWQAGKTGYPIVDAGMRELWHTGWMHNRVRMVVASFLTKHLNIPWRQGAQWFWDTLLDADLANNTMGWQWVAGCGADAAPYFRVFNPTRQGERFDPKGDYVKQWVPELAHLPEKYIHSPWEAPPDTLKAAGIALGKTYPKPMVDHTSAREAALAAYHALP